jgi:cation diffusion facilitator family transporter
MEKGQGSGSDVMGETGHGAASRPGGIAAHESAALTGRITRISVGVAALLVIVKGFAWYFSGSVGLLASMGDSALDFVAAAATFFAVRYAIEPADAEHRFGHGKAEAFASLMQAGLVFASGALLGREAVDHLLHPRPVQAELWGMAVMGLSTVAVIALVSAQSRVLAKTDSVAVHGDRAHYIADAVCNIAALIGLGGAWLMREPRIDALAGLFVAGWLIWGAIGVFREASSQLMDKELDDEERALIKTLVNADPDVRGVHQLRTRASGPFIHIQMHVDLDPDLSLADAHHIVVRAENRLFEAFPAADVLIHADPAGRAEPHGGVFGEGLHEDHRHPEHSQDGRRSA